MLNVTHTFLHESLIVDIGSKLYTRRNMEGDFLSGTFNVNP